MCEMQACWTCIRIAEHPGYADAMLAVNAHCNLCKLTVHDSGTCKDVAGVAPVHTVPLLLQLLNAEYEASPGAVMPNPSSGVPVPVACVPKADIEVLKAGCAALVNQI